MQELERTEAEHQRVENELRESEEKFRSISEISLAGVYIIENENFTYVNKRFAEILGYSVNECLNNLQFQQTVHPEDIGIVRDQIGKRVSGEVDSVNYTFRAIRKSGEIIHLEIFGSKIKLAEKIAVAGSTLDVTARIEAENALRRSESKFRSLFESSRDAVMILDKGRVVDCNAATLEMFGCDNADIFLGKYLSDFSPSFQPSGLDSKTGAQKQISKALSRGSLFFEWIHTRLNGEEFPAEVMLSEVEIEGKQMVQALVRDITQRKIMEDELKRLASTDPLTGANNRRSFLEKGANELLRSLRYKHPLSLLMIDVDHFKTINDTYGHNAGDVVLKALVSKSAKILRGTDILGRLGGEEFAVILPETDDQKAIEVAERLRKGLSELIVKSEEGPIQFTVSIGLAMVKDATDNLVSIMSRSDAAMYKAKENGRNRVVCG